MKVFAFLGAALATDPLPDGYDCFCKTACQDTGSGLLGSDYCPDGFYPHPKDCDAYYLCWDDATYCDKFMCAPGAVFNPVTEKCDWPFNLPEDSECYIPA